jgi:hypothetical protein
MGPACLHVARRRKSQARSKRRLSVTMGSRCFQRVAAHVAMTWLSDGCQKYGDYPPNAAGLVPNCECACIHLPQVIREPGLRCRAYCKSRRPQVIREPGLRCRAYCKSRRPQVIREPGLRCRAYCKSRRCRLAGQSSGPAAQSIDAAKDGRRRSCSSLVVDVAAGMHVTESVIE